MQIAAIDFHSMLLEEAHPDQKADGDGTEGEVIIIPNPPRGGELTPSLSPALQQRSPNKPDKSPKNNKKRKETQALIGLVLFYSAQNYQDSFFGKAQGHGFGPG